MKKISLFFFAFFLLIQLHAQEKDGDVGRAMGNRIACTYLSVLPNSANILQLSADGIMTFIMSDQFDGGGVIGESYSNTKGNWKVSGKREITAGTVDIAFDENGVFEGVAYSRYTIQFDQNSQTATLTCKGAIYPPGVNPMEKNAVHVQNSEFTCGEPIKLKRLLIE